MISSTPSATVPPNSSAQLLLRQGGPFIEFPRFSILELRRQKDHAGNAAPFSEWLTKRLQIGQPFVIQDFEQLETWDVQFFEIEKLIELSTKKSAPPPLETLGPRCAPEQADLALHRHTHPKLQLGQRSQLHVTQVRRFCAPVLPRIPEPLCSGPAMSARMARTMSQDTTNRGAVGRKVGFIPVATSVRQE